MTARLMVLLSDIVVLLYNSVVLFSDVETLLKPERLSFNADISVTARNLFAMGRRCHKKKSDLANFVQIFSYIYTVSLLFSSEVKSS